MRGAQPYARESPRGLVICVRCLVMVIDRPGSLDFAAREGRDQRLNEWDY